MEQSNLATAVNQAAFATDVTVGDRTRGFFHRGTSSDIGVIAQTFTHMQYHPGQSRIDLLRARYSEICASGSVPLIIDAGANIGTSAVWFAETFPDSHIVAIEPDPANFGLLVQNCLSYWMDFRLGAIGGEPTLGYLSDPGRGPLGYTTSVESGLRRLQFVTISELLEEKTLLGMTPFILKCDIEGGEESLFKGDCEWIDLFDLLVAEPHDWMLPGKATSQNMLRAISAFPRDFIFHGENIFSFKN